LAQSLDAPALFALESGDQGGCLVNAGPDDAWQPGPQTSLHFFDLNKTGKLTVRWGRPDAPCYQPVVSWWWVDIYGNSSSYDTSSYHTMILPTATPQRFYRIGIAE